jgi:hypothetical protein
MTLRTAIPSPDGAQNHSPGFARAARSEAAHTAALRTAALLARTGFRVHADGAFCARVRAAYEAGAGLDASTQFVRSRAFVVTFFLTLSLQQHTLYAKLAAYSYFYALGVSIVEFIFPWNTKERRET